MVPGAYRILLVDDDYNLLRLLHDYFSVQGYQVRSVTSGHSALALLREELADIVISDIQMPSMSGFDLFSALDAEFPGLLKVMMTGCDIDGYLRIIREHNVGNIFMKGGDLKLAEISGYVHNLLTGEIFGLERSFSNVPVRKLRVRNELDAHQACKAVLEDYDGADRAMLEIAVNELISNAVFHGVLNMTHVPRDAWQADYVIEAQDAVTVSWAADDLRIGIAVEDPAGRLRKADVLRWFDHPVSEESETDEHGRGLLLIRRLIDRFVINIKPGVKTECILFQYRDRSVVSSSKPLIIHEV